MYLLYLLTGIILACITPILNFEFLGAKGVAYCLIMILFGIVVLGFLILSIYKFKISKIDYITKRTIVSWEIEEENEKKSYACYVVSLACGIALGAYLIFSSAGLLNSILLSLALAFTVLGLWLLGKKRFNDTKSSVPSFVLSHIGLIYGDRIELFNGISKGIINAKEENGELVLDLINGKKQENLRLAIPEDKKQEVADFLTDLNEFFSGAENGEE